MGRDQNSSWKEIETTRFDYILGGLLSDSPMDSILLEGVTSAHFTEKWFRCQCIQFSNEKWGATLHAKCANWD